MTDLIVLRGLPATGKSTWANEWVQAPNRAVVSRDAIRKTTFGVTKSVLSYEKEKIVTQFQQSSVKALLAEGYSVVIDDMNLRPRYVREWRRVAKRHGVEFQIEEFHTTVADSIKDDAERTDSVGAEVITKLAQKFYPKGQFLPVPDEVEEPTPLEIERYVPNPELNEAFVVDLDGTLSLNLGGRSYYDLTRVGEDTVNPPVANVVEALAKDGYTIVFCSGREETSREETQKWLDKLTVNWRVPTHLIMRKKGDQRRDFIIKAELFDEQIAPHFDVRGVFDDRPSVCRTWRAKGLPVFQIGDPHVEF